MATPAFLANTENRAACSGSSVDTLLNVQAEKPDHAGSVAQTHQDQSARYQNLAANRLSLS